MKWRWASSHSKYCIINVGLEPSLLPRQRFLHQGHHAALRMMLFFLLIRSGARRWPGDWLPIVRYTNGEATPAHPVTPFPVRCLSGQMTCVHPGLGIIHTLLVENVFWLCTGREEVLLPSEFTSEMASIGTCRRIQVQRACL